MLLTMQEIENTLKKALPDISEKDIHRAARSITEAGGKWQEIDLSEKLGAELSIQCKDICVLGAAFDKGFRIRAFIAKEP